MPDGRLVPPSHYILATLQPSSTFLTQRTRDQAIGSAADWDQLKAAYGNRCATCGKEAPLEKGHMDPRKPLDIPANCIPMCGDCNGWAGASFVFNTQGRITTVLPVADSRSLFKRLTKRERLQMVDLIGKL